MSAPTASQEIDSYDVVAPALGDITIFGDITDTNLIKRGTLQQVIELYNDLTATITNKTIVAANNTITMASTDLTDTAVIVLENQGNTYTSGLQTFQDRTIRVEDSLSSGIYYTIATSAIVANRNATLPLLTGNDEFVFSAHAQALTNKTIDGDLNTILDINETQMDVSVGGAGTVLTSNGVGSAPSYQAAGAASLPVVDTTSIAEGSADDTKEVRFEVDGNNTGIVGVLATAFTTAKTVTFPDATDTLVGKATTDTFTNKTFDANGTGNSITNIENADIAAGAAIAYSKLNLTGAILNADLAGSITAANLVGTDIDTVGTITTGVWNGTAIASANLDADTMHLSVVQAVTGAKTYDSGSMIYAGATSGTTTLNAAAVAGTTTITMPATTGTMALLENKLDAFAATTSAELITVISGETGSGALTFATNPTFAAIDMNNTKISNIGTTTITDLTDEVSPTTGDFIFGFEATSGQMRKFNIGNLPTGGGGEANTISTLGAGDYALTAGVPKSGVDLRVISISDGTGMSSSLASDDLTIAVDTTVVATNTNTLTLTNKTLDDFTNLVAADDLHLEVRNETGGAFAKGDAIYQSGFDVPEDLPLTTLADSDAGATMPAIGIVNETIANNSNGESIISGIVDGFDTSSWSAGDALYISGTGTTGNTLTNTKPTGTALIQKVATVIRSNPTTGSIFVSGANRSNDIPNIASANFWLGNGSGVATAVTMSGDGSMDNAGALTVNDDSHNHTNSSITLASTDLTDTANIVLNNQSNTYSADTTQTFVSGSNNAAININNQVPTTTNAGDIWRSTDAITYRNNADTTDLVLATLTDLGTFFDTAGNGLTSSGSTVNAVGTSNRISVSADAIDIDAAYVGQATITTLGTITTGTWNGNTIPVANGGTGVTSSTGSTNVVLSVSPTLTTPDIGTPSAGVLTNCTGLPVAGLANGTDGELITWGTTGVAETVAVGTSGHVLTSNGVGNPPTFQAGGAGDMVLADVQTVTGAKTFGTIGGAVGKFILAGSTSGSTIVDASAVASGTITVPAVTDTLAVKGANTFTADQDFGGNNLDNGGVIFLNQQADADADVTDDGQIWIHDTTPNQLMFTDDAGTDFGVSGYQTINFVIDGGGSAITTGKKNVLVVDFDCTVDEWAIVGEPDGAIVVDVNRSTFAGYPTTASIAGTELPTITATNDTGEDRTLTSWSDINAGDIIEFEVDSVTTIERCTVALKVRRK